MKYYKYKRILKGIFNTIYFFYNKIIEINYCYTIIYLNVKFNNPNGKTN